MSAPRGPRTVAWVIDSLRLGGAERLAVELARTPPPGWRVELIALQPAAGPSAAARGERGPHQLHLRRLSDLGEYAKFQLLLRRLGPDLLHTHLSYATIWGAAAAARLRLPHLATLHVLPPAPPPPGPGGARRWLRQQVERRALGRADCRIYVSHSQRAAWEARPAPGSIVLANGTAPAARPDPVEAAEFRRREALGSPLVLTVAVVRTEKGWRDWIAAAERMAVRLPQASFAWVGDGPDFAALSAAVARSPAARRLHLAGARADVAAWLASADLFLFPSHGEALPTAVIEAMAHGLPIVATDLAATREALGEAGRYVPVGDPEALARAALALLPAAAAGEAAARAGQDARRAGAAAERRWREGYGLESWRNRLAELYDQVAERRAPARPRAPAARMAARPAAPGRTILLVEFFGRGGLFHYTWQMAEGFSSAGAEVAVLTARRPELAGAGPAAARLLPELWTWNPHYRPRWLPRRLVRAWRGLRYLAVWLQVLRVVRRERPGMVLLGDLEHRCDGFFVRRLRRGGARRGYRLSVVWHNVESFERNRPGHLLRRQAWRVRLAREFSTVFVHGAALGAQFRQLTGVEPRLIAHGNQGWLARQAGADPHLDRRFLLPPGRPVALLFGSLTPYKGVEDLLAALARIEAPRRPLALISGLPAAAARPAQWREDARRLGLEAWLRWDERYVPSEEIAWYFRRADFVVLPYREAAQSGVAHLALTFGKPLIVTRRGGLPELIDGNGVVVEAGDCAGLADALERLAGDRRLRLRLGRRSAELASSRHDWGAIAAAMLEAWEMGAAGEATGVRGAAEAKTLPEAA